MPPPSRSRGIGVLVAPVLTVALVVNLGGSGAGEVLGSNAGNGRSHHRAAARPAQSWGSAAAQSHVAAGPVNRTVPGTVRGLFPLRPTRAQPAEGHNTASVAAAPARRVTGFDRATSKELPAARTTHERTYANADGTRTTEFSTSALNYRRADGTWAPIDTTVVPAGDPAGGWRTTADSVGLHLAARADAAELARLELDGGHALGYALAGASAAAGRASGDTVSYPGVLPGVDLRLQAQPGGVKESLILHSAAAARDFVFPLRLVGLTPKLVDGQVRLVDAAGTVRAVIPAGSLQDSAPGPAGPATSTAVTYRLETRDGQPALRITADPSWLDDPARRYPVTLDPTVSPPVDSSGADSSMYVHGGTSASGSSELLVGHYDGADAAAYVAFGDLVSRLRYHTIYGAALAMVNYDAPSCRPRRVTVHPVTAPWSAGGGYSYPGPAVGPAIASRSFAHGYIGLGQSSSPCPAAAELFDLGNAGRALVQRWVNGEQPNYGLSLRASTTDSGAWKRFAGSGTANPPRLYVTHTPYNATYAIPSPTPEPPVLQNQDGKVKVTVTNLGAEAWAPGAYYLAYRAYDAKTGAAVTQQRAANLTTTVARKAKVTLDATIKALPPGAYFLDFTMVHTGGPVFTDHLVPPGRIVLQVFDIPPVVQELFPPNGYQAPTLTPLLWARAVDTDAPPGSSLQFTFEVCDTDTAGAPVSCTSSGYSTAQSWVVPAGRLAWSKTYLWRAVVKDATTEVPSAYSAVLTTVPQPDITSKIAGAPNSVREHEFDPQVGNLSTSALDATVATVGPELNVARTYNSLDPRTGSAFGAGWSTRYDMAVVPDNDGSGNVVVTYPDGQQVRFGKNPDGSYVPPAGRTASLTVDATSWKLLDRSGTTYQFALTGKLVAITDNSSHSVKLSYDTSGRLSKAQVSNSQTNTAGRALRFAWAGDHVTAVTTDAVKGAPLVWTYSYDGDLLTSVCAPTGDCTTYAYAPGSHYRTAVQDARPESYWRLGDSAAAGAVDGAGAASDVAVNLGKDAGTYHGVTLGTPGALEGTPDTAASFSGTSSYLELPKGALKKSRDAAVELWFRIGLTQTGGPLIGYQDAAVGAAAGTGVPVLYTGTDGRLRGQFARGSISPITSGVAVNDNAWHHVVLSLMGTTQTLYLDGTRVGERTGVAVDASLLTVNQVGAASATPPGSWPAWGSAAQRYFAGDIDEVALYSHPLGAATAAAHAAARSAARQLTRVTLPSGRVAAGISYDTSTDRVKEYTDGDGGTWKVGRPAVYGGDDDLRRSVEVLDPANRPSLYEYDAIAGRLLRQGTPLGLETRPEDLPQSPTPSPTTPTETCTQPDPQDPAFCTIIPGDAGGPVFVRHSLDGLAIRTFSYDAQGHQTKVTNENGYSVDLSYDARGNVTSSRTCRTAERCFTTYNTYPDTISNAFDPRNDLVTETRDGRSASATDGSYVTHYTYAYTGALATQTNPDGSVVRNTYTNGAEAAVGGGIQPSGLLATTTDPRGKVTRYAYYANGDLAKVTDPLGLVTRYSYDELGRKVSETEVSDTYPGGLTTGYDYDGVGWLVSTTAPAVTDAVTGAEHQARTSYGYDADGNVTTTTVSDLRGGDADRVSTTEYDSHGRPARVTDAEGNETSYEYDRFGNTTSTVDANGVRTDFAYTARNKIAEVRLRNWQSDAPGAPATGTGDYLVLHSYSYDYAGRLASDTDSMGRRLEYEYYQDDLLYRVVLKDFHDPDGSTRDYVLEQTEYDGAGNPVKKLANNGLQVVENTVDKVGRVTSTVVNPGAQQRTTTFSYDLGGNVLRTTRSGGASNVPWAVAAVTEQVRYTYDDAGNELTQQVLGSGSSQLTSYTYDRRGLQTSATDPRGNLAGADKAAFTTTVGYDALGRRTTVTTPPVATESGGQPAVTSRPVTRFGYDTFGGQTSVADPLGNVSRTEYDRLGRPVRSIAPSYTPPGGAAITPTTSTAYDGLGNVVSVVDPLGAQARFSYDQLGRMLTRDEPAATNDERAVTRYTYTRTGEVLSVTGPTGARTEATYDDLDRQVTATQVERYPVADNYTSRITHDDAGNVIATSTPTGATTTNAFDINGELIRQTSPNGVVTTFGYDFAGRQVRASDGLGRTTRVGYDLFGNRVSDSALDPAGVVLRTQTYGYDAAGNLTSSTDPYGVTTSYGYDALDRLVRQVEPVNATSAITTTFGYDAAGNRTRYTDGRGNATVYEVNSLGLAAGVVEPSTTAYPQPSDRTWTVGYDAAARPVTLVAPGGVTRQRGYDAAGRLVREAGSGAESATATRTLGYDLAGRLTSVSAPAGTNTYSYDDRGELLATAGPGGTADFGYDGDGNMTLRRDAAGQATFGYVKGRLSSLTDAVTGVTEQLRYDAAGEVASIDYGGGQVRGFGYDDFGRLSSDTLRNGGGQTLASISYGFDLNGHVTRKTTTGTAGAGDNTYGYDQAGRLTSWTGPQGTVDYAWDASGNRIKAGAKTATYDERNRLLSDGDYTYTYSARGTLRGRTSSGLTDEYSFDAFDRMVTAGAQSYSYDGLDRVATRDGTAFTYAGRTDDVISDGAQTYARGPAEELLAVAQGSEKRFAIADAHGDIVAELDPTTPEASSVAESAGYDPFGVRVASSDTIGNIGFQGDWTDPGTGQVDMGARWYNPGAGVFDSRDAADYTAGDSILANRYTYGAGAPLDFDDPSGQWPSILKRVARGLSSAAHYTGRLASSAWHGVSAGWHTFTSYAGAAWRWGVSAFKASPLGRAASWVYHKSGLDRVVNKAREGWHALRSGNFTNWAKQQAVQVAKKVYRAKVALTRAAKAAVKTAIQHSPIPAIVAAAKPLIKTAAKIITSAAKIAPKLVATTVTAIRDPAKFASALYDKAVEQAGVLIENVSHAAQAVGQFVQEHSDAIVEGLAIAGSIAAGLACTAATAGAGAVACMVGAAALINVAKDAAEGNVHSFGDAFSSAAIGGAQGLLGAGAGVVGGKVAGVLAGRLGSAAGSLGGRMLSGAAAGAASDATYQLATTGHVDVGEVAAGAGVGAAFGGRFRAGRGCNSFTGATTVRMADGTHKLISDVRVGDTVLATDPTTGRTEKHRVSDVIIGTGQKSLVAVTVQTGSGERVETSTVIATDAHPFWVEGQHRWVEAKDLKPGYTFETADHRPATVAGTRAWSQYQRVYNLTVDSLHTYYVAAGTADVLVHNCPSTGDTSGEATVFLDAGASPKHASIRVDYGGISLHTEQRGTRGTDAVGQYFSGSLSSGPVFPIKIALPNAARAQAFQKATEEYTFGSYDETSRSCVTYCADVLRAGGVEGLPEDTKPILRWLWRRH